MSNFTVQSFSAHGEHYLALHLDYNNSIALEIKCMIADFFNQNRIQREDTVFIKVFTTNFQAFQSTEEILKDFAYPDSIIQIHQPPLVSDISILISTISPSAFKKQSIRFHFNHYRNSGSNVADETRKNFAQYLDFLNSNNLNLLDNSIRSWIYVNDIDTRYNEMVSARGNFFHENNMGPHSRFLASTGIGADIQTQSLSQIDFLTIEGIQSSDITRMVHHEVMPDTITYGVHFERGLKVSFESRDHFYISGTASINSKGQIEHIGNPEKQTQLAMKNFTALLENYGSKIRELSHLIVYLRNPADLNLIHDLIIKSIPNIPVFFLQGSVCRPDWLVEIEGMAITPKSLP